MSEMSGTTSLYQQSVEERALAQGKTAKQVIADDRACALSTEGMTPDCLLPDEAQELLRAGVRFARPFVLPEEGVPHMLKDASEHLLRCDFCQTLISVMTLSTRNT